MSNYVIPPIISDWLSKLNDPGVSEHIRENYRMMIENVVDACDKELIKYKSLRNSSFNKDVSKKKKQK